MDKSVKIILGIAIAVLYPILVWFAVYTFIPTPPTKPSQLSYPVQPTLSSECDTTYNKRSVYNPITRQYETRQYTTSDTTKNIDCSKKKAKYQEELREYEEKKVAYENKVKDDQKRLDQIVIWRAQFAVILSLLGLVAVIASVGIPALAGGVAAGATFTIVIAITYLLPSALDKGEYSNISVILLLISFVLLVVEMWFVDNKLLLQNNEINTAEPASDLPSTDVNHLPPSNVMQSDSKDQSEKPSTNAQ